MMNAKGYLDIESLTAEPQCRPILWQDNRKDYGNESLMGKIWQEVGHSRSCMILPLIARRSLYNHGHRCFFNDSSVFRASYDERYIFRPVALINSFCCVHMHRGAKQESLKKKQNAREQQTTSRSHQQVNAGQNKSSMKPKLTHRGLVSLVRK